MAEIAAEYSNEYDVELMYPSVCSRVCVCE